MKRWITAFGALLMMTTNSGCKGIVFDPIQAEAQDGGAGADGGPFAGGIAGKAVAMRFGDWTIPDDTSANIFDVSITVPQDPDALVLFFSDAIQACSQPVMSPDISMMPCDPNTAFSQMILMIPPELDRPGLIDLTDTRIAAYESVWFSNCGGGGGNTPGFRGTLEIVSSDATSLSVKLHVGVHQAGWPSLDGEYTALRCGAPPPVSPPSPAMAVLGANLPAPPGGPAPDPTALYLFMGTAAQTCQDPWASIGCTQTSRVVLSLPPALQKPGIINLSDPAIAARYADSRDPPWGCTAYDQIGGTMPNGTIEILSIDASGLSYKVYGSHIDNGGGGFNTDGLYAASICP